jgi:hypothetical protein
VRIANEIKTRRLVFDPEDMAAILENMNVEKHGTHDQKTHAGRRGGTGSQTFDTLGAFTETLNNLENRPLSDEEMYELSGSQNPEYGQSAVFAYVNNSRGLNSALRADEEFAEQTYGSLISELDETMARTPNITRSITVYRGVSGGTDLPEVFETMEEGDIFSDSAFVSTSLDPNAAIGFAGGFDAGPEDQGIVFEIGVPANSEGIFPNSWLGVDLEDNSFASELEFLLPRDSQFKLLSREGKVWKVGVVNG